MAREQAPASWVRVQALVDASGWPAVLAMAGQDVTPGSLAVREAARLQALHGVTVLRDGAWRPCVDPADPGVQAWRDELDERVTETAAAIERDLGASRHGTG